MEPCYANNQKSLFRKYAKLVTWLANTNVGRDYLKHNNLYIPNEKIGLLLPNGYIRLGTVAKDKIEAQLVVTTFDCYENKLAVALTKLDIISNWIKDFSEARELLAWYLGLRYRPPFAIRGWDILFAVTTFNSGTNGTGTIWNTTGAGTTWATTINAASGSNVSDNSDPWCDNYGIQGSTNMTCGRAYHTYDTSSLTSSATITDVVNKLYFNFINSSPDSLTFGLFQSTQSSPTALALADYSAIGSTVFASIAVTSITIDQYTSLTLNASGRNNVSLTGYSKFVGRQSADYNNSAPTASTGNGCQFKSGGFTSPPQLVVTYTVPSTAAFLSMFV